ncbi:MAG TPA: hypothetical protein VG722_07200, partial [Tepidisphaeraceae bacterium]|nr:hypothetical protein [Tepidisphaeraceae bacterium]
MKNGKCTLLSFAAGLTVVAVCRWSVAANIYVKSVSTQGNVTTYSYDSTGTASETVDTQGHVTTYSYDSQSNRTYPSPPTSYSYDALGTVNPTPPGNPTTYGYDDHDTGDVNGTDDTSSSDTYSESQGGTTRYTYDQLNEQVQETDPLGHVTHYQYDSDHGVTQEMDSDGQGNTTTTTYDDLNRQVQTIDDVGTSSTNTYDSIQGTVEFTDEQPTRYQYDAMGRITLESGEGTINNLDISLYDETTNTPIFDIQPTPIPLDGLNPTYQYDSSSQSNLHGTLTPGDTYRYQYSYELDPGATSGYGNIEAKFNLNFVPLPASAFMGMVLMAGLGGAGFYRSRLRARMCRKYATTCASWRSGHW